MTWSVVWEAVAAVGTMLAVVWAVYTTLTERRKRSAVEEQLTKEQAASRVAKRREQAAHVAVWFETRRIYVSTKIGQTVDVTVVIVGNYSSAPIFSVVATGEALLTGKDFIFGHDSVVPPAPDLWERELEEAAPFRGELRVHVEFDDVAGVRWRRSSDGGLVELPKERPQI